MGRAYFILSAIFILTRILISCESEPTSAEQTPEVRIDSIIPPPVAEYPGTATFRAVIDNPENLNIELRWSSSCGELSASADSAVVTLPDLIMDASITLQVLIEGDVLAEKSLDYQIIPPAFVGNFALAEYETCSGTITYNTNNSPLLLDIYETFRTAVGFAYAWRIANSNPRLSIPDSCFVQMRLRSHYGFSGRYLSQQTRADSLFYFTYPTGQGNFTIVYKWKETPDGIILDRRNTDNPEIWHFRRTNP